MKEIKYGALTLVLDEETESYTVISCDKNAERVEIPMDIDGYYIDAIGEYAFDGCTMLKEVDFKVPESEEEAANYIGVSTIEDYAFNECISLQNVDIPYSVTMIGRGAFYGCHALETVTFNPDIYIAPYAFCHCHSLKTVTPMSSDISEGVFSNCKSMELFPVIEGSDEIGEDAFEHCYALEHIVIPKTVKRIEALAFRSCFSLKTVKFAIDDGWYCKWRYLDGTEREIDVSKPTLNAQSLSRMDFDDGVIAGYRK